MQQLLEPNYVLLLTMTKFLKPVKTKFLMSSQPIPPAPTTNTLQVDTVVLNSSLRRLTAMPRHMGGDYLKPHPLVLH